MTRRGREHIGKVVLPRSSFEQKRNDRKRSDGTSEIFYLTMQSNLALVLTSNNKTTKQVADNKQQQQQQQQQEHHKCTNDTSTCNMATAQAKHVKYHARETKNKKKKRKKLQKTAKNVS